MGEKQKRRVSIGQGINSKVSVEQFNIDEDNSGGRNMTVSEVAGEAQTKSPEEEPQRVSKRTGR